MVILFSVILILIYSNLDITKKSQFPGQLDVNFKEKKPELRIKFCRQYHFSTSLDPDITNGCEVHKMSYRKNQYVQVRWHKANKTH